MIVRRYARTDVALAPLWEWWWLKGIEAVIQAGQIDASEFLAGLENQDRRSSDLGIDWRAGIAENQRRPAAQ